MVPTIRRKGLAAVSAGFCAAVCSGFSDAEVVHIHGEGPAFWCGIPKLLGKRVVVTVHGLDWKREKWKGSFGAEFIRWGEKAAVRSADEIIVLSADTRCYFQKTYSRRTVYIPNGTSAAEKLEPREITQKYGLEKDGYFLFLGRLVPEKGIHHLIRAFRDVGTSKRLVIAGSASDTDAYAAELHRLAAADRRVLFTGFAAGRILGELYSNAYAYVLPSELEGMPISLLEAMSYGCCCVVSDIPGCAETVEDHGLLFPRGNTAALRECLQQLCDRPELAEHYRAGAAALVRGKYNWDEVTEQTLALYGGDRL